MVGQPTYGSVCTNCDNFSACRVAFNKTDSPVAWVKHQTMFETQETVTDAEHEHATLKYGGRPLVHGVMSTLYEIFTEAGLRRKEGMSESDMTSGTGWFVRIRGKVRATRYYVIRVKRADMQRVVLDCPLCPYAKIMHKSHILRVKGGSSCISLPTLSVKTKLPKLVDLIIKESDYASDV